MTNPVQKVLGSILGPNLHELIERKQWTLVQERCKSHPNEVANWSTEQNFFGKHASCLSPLHLACSLQPPWTVVESLIIAHPECVRAKELRYNRLPLHVACEDKASVEVVRTLLTYYPDGAKVQDVLGRIPLHYACCAGETLDVIEALLTDYAHGARCKDFKGWLPIHISVKYNPNLEVSERLLQAFPECTHSTTDKGSTPIDCAETSRMRNKDLFVSLLKSERWVSSSHLQEDEDDAKRIFCGTELHSKNQLM